MNLAHGCALAVGLGLLVAGLWHLGLGGSERRAPALPDRATPAPELWVPLQAAEGVERAVPTDDPVAPFEPTTAEIGPRTSVPVEPAKSESDAPDEDAQLDLGLVNPGARPVATDRSSLARDWAPSLAVELGWALSEEELGLLGTWLAGHERRERRLLESEREPLGAAAQAHDDLRGWFQSFDALFGEQRGVALRRRLEQR